MDNEADYTPAEVVEKQNQNPATKPRKMGRAQTTLLAMGVGAAMTGAVDAQEVDNAHDTALDAINNRNTLTQPAPNFEAQLDQQFTIGGTTEQDQGDESKEVIGDITDILSSTELESRFKTRIHDLSRE